jgi:threo-3-hydroxy-L-aspartate ammonia-lyase
MEPRRRGRWDETVTEIELADVRDAAERLEGVAHRTPVMTSRTLDEAAGASVFLKCENLQRVGAFKFRGAYNAISRLTPEQLGRGIAAFSSGNHAQAVALAARMTGSTAVILMPADSPPGKTEAVRDYGAEIITFDRYTEDRDSLLASLAAERGLTPIPPYEHRDVITGQGTAALELIEEVSGLDVVVAPVGGGGLLAGTATVAKALGGIAVVGVEPEAGDDTRRSLAAGERVRVPVPRTIADGQAVSIPGEMTFAINRRLVDDIVLVSDDELRDALRFAFDRLKTVLEPSGASGLAALLTKRVPLPAEGARVGVILSGGNVGWQRFADLMSAPPAP